MNVKTAPDRVRPGAVVRPLMSVPRRQLEPERITATHVLPFSLGSIMWFWAPEGRGQLRGQLVQAPFRTAGHVFDYGVQLLGSSVVVGVDSEELHK